VRLELHGGEVRESAVLDPRGMPADPCTDGERIDKFTRLASSLLARPQVDRIVEIVSAIERQSSMQALSKLLAPQR
jgi:hypothetical protein